MNIHRRTPELGNWWMALSESVKPLFTAKGGQSIIVPGAPAALSMGVVGVLAGAVVLMVIMKKKNVI